VSFFATDFHEGRGRQLHLDSRPVGNVLVIQCDGRIVAGAEVSALHFVVENSLPKYADIILQLDQVGFIDSTGLGALVHLASTARSKGGGLRLCGLQQHVRKVLEVTDLLSRFEIYDSLAEAIMAAYLGSCYSKDKSGDAQLRILCVYDTVDVRTFLTEMLCRAGYNALATANVDDARILLKAIGATLVIIGAHMQTVQGKSARRMLEEIDPRVSLLVLDEHFSQDDPGDAAAKVLQSIRSQRKQDGTALFVDRSG